MYTRLTNFMFTVNINQKNKNQKKIFTINLKIKGE